MSSVDKGITLFEITFSGNVISGRRYDIIRDNHSAAMSSVGQRYNIIRDNIQRAMSSVDKGITLLEITFSGKCHQWTKV